MVLYWFVNQQFLGKSKTQESLLWKAQPGKFTIRVVNDKGCSAVRTVRVVANSQN